MPPRKIPVLLLLFFIAAFLAGRGCLSQGITTQATSPNGKAVAILLERDLPMSIDRNFIVEVRDTATNNVLYRFRSPDEGRPPGTERFFWSDDSEYVLLVGQHFFTKPKLAFGNHGDAYLLFRPETGEAWCNASPVASRRISVSLLREAGLSPE